MKVWVYRNLRRGRGKHNCFWSIRHKRKVINKHERTPNLVLVNVDSKINSKTLETIKETGKKTPAVFLVGEYTETFIEVPPSNAERITFNPMFHNTFIWAKDDTKVTGPLDRVWFTKDGVFSIRGINGRASNQINKPHRRVQ